MTTTNDRLFLDVLILLLLVSLFLLSIQPGFQEAAGDLLNEGVTRFGQLAANYLFPDQAG